MLAALAVAGSPASADVDGAQLRLDRIRGQHAKVVQFLQKMPKGADLHTHLSGATYGESLIGWAAGSGKCVDPDSAMSSMPPCTGQQRPISDALTDTDLFNRILAAWSFRGFVPGQQSGHDHYFRAFDLFSAAKSGVEGDSLAEVTQRAAWQRVQHVEPMVTADFSGPATVAAEVGYSRDLDRMRASMVAAGLFDTISRGSSRASTALARRAQVQNCGTVQAGPGCSVSVRFINQVARNERPEVVFAQLLYGFELAARDRNWAGLNMVGEEDGFFAVRDYSLHMRMISYLRALYPGVQVALHAGEYVPGMVPPQDLRFHIRAAVEVAGASRIGHGADLKWERDPQGLMDRMRRDRVCVEINLTSNRQILELSGKRHPVRDYWRNGVLVTLSTDAEGVLRTDLTHQYQRAVDEHGFGYRDLKRIARNGLSCSYLSPAQKRRARSEQDKLFRRFERRFG